MPLIILWPVLWLVMACSAYADESNNSDAKIFLEQIVKSDFFGDASPRIGHVFRLRQYLGSNDLAPGPAFETYDLDSDPLVIVKDWKLDSFKKKTDLKACGKFSFTVVAVTVGEGLPSWTNTKARQIIPLKNIKTEKVDYCAKFNHDMWILVDAPLPRVSKEHLIAFMKQRSARAEKIFAGMKSTDSRAIINTQRILNSLKEQLAVLSNINY